MFILEETINCKSRSDRIEIFPFYDCHVGKFNCDEDAIKKQITEIIRRSELPNRHVRVFFGGDNMNSIKATGDKRFDFGELADWLVEGKAANVKDKLSDICGQEINHFCELFDPIKHLTLGAMYGNHEKGMKTRNNTNVHEAMCQRMGFTNLTDECLLVLHFRRGKRASKTIIIYARHGYGGGRTAGAEANKLEKLINEWECADVSLSGHTHSFRIEPPKPAPYIFGMKSKNGPMLAFRSRWGANPGCWLLSHKLGPGSYESMQAYPARAMMTLKIVVWPFYNDGKTERSKLELRHYDLL